MEVFLNDWMAGREVVRQQSAVGVTADEAESRLIETRLGDPKHGRTLAPSPYGYL
jgi:hypothetical protein